MWLFLIMYFFRKWRFTDKNTFFLLIFLQQNEFYKKKEYVTIILLYL